MDSDTAKRIQILERTVDILTYHLLLTNINVEDLLDRLPHGEYSTVRLGITKNIQLLEQIKKIGKQ